VKIRHVSIHNFRSILDLDFATTDMMVFLGPNNHGKSNVLSALEFALSAAAKPDRDDVCALCTDQDPEVWVELTFAGLTEQERTTFQKYIRADGSLKIRKTARWNTDGAAQIEYQGYIQQPGVWWLQASAWDRLGTLDMVSQAARDVPELQPLADAGGRMTKQRLEEFQRAYVQEHRAELTFSEVLEDSPLLGTKNVAGGVLPDFYLVPAVRDLSDEVKVKTTTTFGRLLQRAVSEMTARDPRFADLRERMASIVEELNARPTDQAARSHLAQIEDAIASELKDWGVSVSIEVTPPEIERLFELGTQLHLDDGLKTPAERKGHGLQRAVMFALLRAWAGALRTESPDGASVARRASESVVFAVEEPELFLHPHAQRQLAHALRDIAVSPGHQVFVCSHSTHFVNLDHYRSIAIVTKSSPQEGTRVRQCACDLFGGDQAQEKKNRFHMAAWVNPDRSEMFFARKVILVEGETEKTTLPFLATKIGCYDPNVSIVDCGAKHNFPLYLAIANAFRLRYVVVHDEDPLPNPVPDAWSEDKIREKRHTYELNDTIREMVDAELGTVWVCCPDFEGFSGVSHTQGERKGKPLAALDHFIDQTADQVPANLAELVRAAYA
jgi:CRISPR-associated exonuclease Cas4